MESYSDALMSHPDYAMPWRIATPLTHAKLYAVLPIARLRCNNPVALRFLSSFALHLVAPPTVPVFSFFRGLFAPPPFFGGGAVFFFFFCQAGPPGGGGG